MPRYAGASIARMKRGGVSATVAALVLAIGIPCHAVAGWCDGIGGLDVEIGNYVKASIGAMICFSFLRAGTLPFWDCSRA